MPDYTYFKGSGVCVPVRWREVTRIETGSGLLSGDVPLVVAIDSPLFVGHRDTSEAERLHGVLIPLGSI